MTQKLYVLIISSALLFSCGNSTEMTHPADNKPVLIPVVRLAPVDTTIYQEYVADIQASKNVEIRARIQGFIEEILVDEGQEVEKGQPLFRLSSAEFDNELARAGASLAKAKAEAKAAELELKRVKTLVSKNIISQPEADLAEAKVRSAEAKVAEAKSLEENARIRLGYTYIRSPFNGVIDRIPQKRGSLVDQGTLLTTISDLEHVYAYFSVSESEYLRYQRANNIGRQTAYDDIRLLLADGTEFPYRGKVETMESEFNSGTGSIAFRATFPNPGKMLKHGASGTILLKNSMNNALIIPQKAVMEIQDRSFVFLVDKNNTVKMKSFNPKERIDEYVVVQSGLSENDAIVYEGIQNIREGAVIAPKYIQLNNSSRISYRQ